LREDEGVRVITHLLAGHTSSLVVSFARDVDSFLSSIALSSFTVAIAPSRACNDFSDDLALL